MPAGTGRRPSASCDACGSDGRSRGGARDGTVGHVTPGGQRRLRELRQAHWWRHPVMHTSAGKSGKFSAGRRPPLPPLHARIAQLWPPAQPGQCRSMNATRSGASCCEPSHLHRSPRLNSRRPKEERAAPPRQQESGKSAANDLWHH